MLFDYRNPNNKAFLINAAQITHVVFIILAILFIIHLVMKFNSLNSLQRLYIHGCFVLIVGVGCLINALAVNDVIDLNMKT